MNSDLDGDGLFGADILGDNWPPVVFPPPDPALAAEHEAIRAPQLAFNAVVDNLIDIYRTFDRTRRPAIKAKMKDLYESLKLLGERIGVSRIGLDSLWRG